MSEEVSPSGPISPLVFRGAVLAGRYRLEDIVGSGGMGAVWSATHLGIGQQVALKLVYANFARSADALQRFDREAKAVAKIKSRHVPQVYDSGVLEDGTPFLAMELLHGETLFNRVHKLGPVPLPEAISILDQCCVALGKAHALGIVHRDIKPDNIFLAQDNEVAGYVVKVLDFGIAKVTQLGDAGHSSTRTGALMGTPQYMSPEQARALKSIDLRTDLYSLGLVAYTMLTGNLAFSGESLGDLLLQICAQPLPSLIGAAPWLPPTMENWFLTACAREPSHRYPTAQAFLEALRAAADGTLASAGPTAHYGGGYPMTTGRASGVAPSLGAPSTTGASSLAIPARPPGAHAPWVLLAVSAFVGVVIALGVVIVVMRGHKMVTTAAPPPLASQTPSTVPEAGADFAVKVEPVQTATTAAHSASTATGGKPPLPSAWHPAPGPVVPSVPAAASTKPKGTIDLGY